MKHTRTLAATLLLTCLAFPALGDTVSSTNAPDFPLLSQPPVPNSKTGWSTPALLQGIKDRLPSITLVKQPYVRSVVVLKVNCPVEVLTGITIPPIDLARQALDKTAVYLNEKELFSYDIQFVCG